MRAKAKITAAVLALSFAVTSYAAVDIDAIHYDDTAVVAGSELVLNGAGMRKKVFFKVYAAGLYLPAKASDGSEVFGQKGAARVRLGLLRDVSASSFVSALEEGLKDNTDEKTRTEIASEIAALIEAMNKIGDVKEGDVVDFDFRVRPPRFRSTVSPWPTTSAAGAFLMRSWASGSARTPSTTSSKRAS